MFERGDFRQAQFAHQTVLEGAPQALDAALGLRRTGHDDFDAQFLKRATHLGRQLFSGQLLFQRPMVIVALQSGMLVTIQSQGNARSCHQRAQQVQIAGAVFVLELEVRGGYLAGGVVDQSQQRQLRPAPFQPIVAGAIDEQ